MTTVDEIIEELQGTLIWITNHKGAGWVHQGRCNEKDITQLHEIAWQLVEVTRPEEKDDGSF